MADFEIGERVEVVLVREGLYAQIGDVAVVQKTANPDSTDPVITVKWECERGPRTLHVYANQFARVCAPW